MRVWIPLALLLAAAGFAAEPEPPSRLTLRSKKGDIVFDHAAHLKREGGHCAACHDKLWPKSAAAPVGTHCRACHASGSKAFEMKGNCSKCHPGA